MYVLGCLGLIHALLGLCVQTVLMLHAYSGIVVYLMEVRTEENEACTNIPIEDDDIFEGDEYSD